MHYYKQIENRQIISMEAKSSKAISPNFIKATKAEYGAFVASLPIPEPPKPPRDLEAEIDGIKARLDGAGI